MLYHTILDIYLPQTRVYSSNASGIKDSTWHRYQNNFPDILLNTDHNKNYLNVKLQI